MIVRIRVAFAQARLRRHMYDRLIGGGTPDCPCARCERDEIFLDEADRPWNHPARIVWWRDFERTLKRAQEDERMAGKLNVVSDRLRRQLSEIERRR